MSEKSNNSDSLNSNFSSERKIGKLNDRNISRIEETQSVNSHQSTPKTGVNHFLTFRAFQMAFSKIFSQPKHVKTMDHLSRRLQQIDNEETEGNDDYGGFVVGISELLSELRTFVENKNIMLKSENHPLEAQLQEHFSLIQNSNQFIANQQKVIETRVAELDKRVKDPTPHEIMEINFLTQKVDQLISSHNDLQEKVEMLKLSETGILNSTSSGSHFEHLISRLIKAESECFDGIDNLPFWKDPALLYGKENIIEPLTSLSNDFLKKEAVKLFKSVQLFISVPLDSAGIDYHVSLIQNSLHLCITYPELQSELLAQLIKQTSPHVNQRLCGVNINNFILCASQSIFTCDTSGAASEENSPTSNSSFLPSTNTADLLHDKSNPRNHVFIQGFQFLALAISLFVPKTLILWLLRNHIRRCSDTKTEMGKYAIYCQRTLERTLNCGPREFRPSRMEVLSILLRNPYHHSLPHSIPVHFSNQSYLVISFDGSTSVEEFIKSLNNQSGIRPIEESGFALYSDDPIDRNVEHLLDKNNKLADIIARWEVVLREKHLGKFENTRIVKLIYKPRLCLKRYTEYETDKEKLFIVYEINSCVISGRFPATQELALELAALMSQIEFGDFAKLNHAPNVIHAVLEKFFPSHFREIIPFNMLTQFIRDKWMELKGQSTGDCIRTYLNCTRKWSLCGAKLFEAKPSKPIKVDMSNSLVIAPHSKIWIAINDEAIALLDYNTLQVISQFPLRSLVTYEGCEDEFMIVVRQHNEMDSGSGSSSGCSRKESIRPEKMLFMMAQPSISDLTQLITDYINAIVYTNTFDSNSGHTFNEHSAMNSCSRNASFRTNASSRQTKL